MKTAWLGQTKKVVALLMIVSFLTPSLALAVDGNKAAYFGGTVGIFQGAKEPVEGRLDTANETALGFYAEDKPFTGQSLKIPYEAIEDLEFGQKAGRRVGAAVATTILLGPLGLLTLFSKKKKHYLTVGYTDATGKSQVAVIELGKDIVRATLPIIETRSGKKVTFQDDEAKKSVK
jgi:hypothetical protein